MPEKSGKNFHFKIPKEVSCVTSTLQNAGHEAYLVGGCVRDLLRGKKPKDWDITTNATPEEIVGLFPHAFYENDFGTVGVVTEGVKDKTLEVIEVTTYRLEASYTDSRHPDSVAFSKHLEDDLKRRDFTINAIACNVSKGRIIDPYKGQEDLERKVVRAVGNPKERFNEDALRIIRAVRLATELGFTISHETAEAITEFAPSLQKIAKERIRDEFIRIILSDNPMQGMILSQKLGILRYIIPDLERGIGIRQNQAHVFDVWEHNLRTLQHAADKKWGLEIRLAALLHDISKPETRQWAKDRNDWTFHGHDVIGSRITRKILTTLKFPKKTVGKVAKLVRWHMFFSDPEKVTLSAVRRLMRNVGREDVWDLMNLRICDRIGTGRPKEQPYRFRKYKAMVEEVMRDPISVKMLGINGNEIMKLLDLPPGPKIGHILHALLEEVLEDPKRNTREYLKNRTLELSELPEDTLKSLGNRGREKKEEVEKDEIKKIREKYWVK
jgi:poly(A) polymerase/tRNA nucleotidyltransferase (CCA-adding enzyme)